MMNKLENIINISKNTELKFPVENYNYNLSLLPIKETLKVAFRNSNVFPYCNARGRYSAIYTGNIIDDEIVNLEKINFRGYSTRLWDKYNGMEDPKIFIWKDDLWCLFVRPNHSITKIFMIMLNLNTGHSIIFDDPEGRPYTKNWMPYVDGEKIYFVVDTSPFALYELINENLKLIKNNDGMGYPINGGSNIIEFNGRLVSVVHGKTGEGRKRDYWHAIAHWDKDFNDMKLGEKFTFDTGGIEFCLSISKLNDKILIPYSLDDNGVSVIEVKEEEFGKLL